MCTCEVNGEWSGPNPAGMCLRKLLKTVVLVANCLVNYIYSTSLIHMHVSLLLAMSLVAIILFSHV